MKIRRSLSLLLALTLLLGVFLTGMSCYAEEGIESGEGTQFQSLQANQKSMKKKKDFNIYKDYGPNTVILYFRQVPDLEDLNQALTELKKGLELMPVQLKPTPLAKNVLTLYVEAAIEKVGRELIDGIELKLDAELIKKNEARVEEAKSALDKALSEGDVKRVRPIRSYVYFHGSKNELKVTVDKALEGVKAENIILSGPDFRLSLPVKALSGDSDLEIVVSYADRKVSINFSREIEATMDLSFSLGEFDYPIKLTVMDTEGKALGGNYNPVTKMLSVKIKKGGTYALKENVKNFDDISEKHMEMQEAVNNLAAKGIINGVSETKFNPDGDITRAELAALMVRTLSRLDEKADGGFGDVKQGDWYFSAVASAKKAGLMKGVSDSTFSPHLKVNKEQIIAVLARVLREEMDFTAVDGVDKVLEEYKDQASIPNWAREDIALATREELVINRSDEVFLPKNNMTRGEVAILLNRLLMKLI